MQLKHRNCVPCRTFLLTIPSYFIKEQASPPALRHLWVLAVEPRRLIARDVDTKGAVYLLAIAQVREKDDKRSTWLISPTLLSDSSHIIAIKVDTLRYWPFIIDILKFLPHRVLIIPNQPLLLKRRIGYLGYSEDPKGSWSIFARVGAASGDEAMLEYPEERPKLLGRLKTSPIPYPLSLSLLGISHLPIACVV